MLDHPPPKPLPLAANQYRLARFNHRRLTPTCGTADWRADLRNDGEELALEAEFLDAALACVAPLMADVPADPDRFMAWFEALKESGPGQGDPLFPWLAESASLEQMVWFLTQEIAGEAGFDDLVALTQVKMPQQPKLEMARNYWDEMGRGNAKGMHGPLLHRLAEHLNIETSIERTVPEALALGNVLVGLACNRRFAFHSIGALGAIELTAPTRAGYVVDALRRLGVPARARQYFALHAVLDVRHSAAWNEEVLRPLVVEDAGRCRALAEGALLRLWCGARCFDRYRAEFGLSRNATVPAAGTAISFGS